ncbi:hypothetical protein C8034_v007823 [Colletotrichum sidae]|uniref:Uncharacterized protein n=1 Tax=Colletotrichum sidae TaxID=1347389 RepID=A0A4R8T3C0_9PEZI|nr:hypothetical protein C8034_v007823 [Colletotrichum sidae]
MRHTGFATLDLDLTLDIQDVVFITGYDAACLEAASRNQHVPDIDDDVAEFLCGARCVGFVNRESFELFRRFTECVAKDPEYPGQNLVKFVKGCELVLLFIGRPDTRAARNIWFVPKFVWAINDTFWGVGPSLRSVPLLYDRYIMIQERGRALMDKYPLICVATNEGDTRIAEYLKQSPD